MLLKACKTHSRQYRAKSPDALCTVLPLVYFQTCLHILCMRWSLWHFPICRHCCGRAVLPDSFCCPCRWEFSCGYTNAVNLSTPNRNSGGMRHFCSKSKGFIQCCPKIWAGYKKSLSVVQADRDSFLKNFNRGCWHYNDMRILWGDFSPF